MSAGVDFTWAVRRRIGELLNLNTELNDLKTENSLLLWSSGTNVTDEELTGMGLTRGQFTAGLTAVNTVLTAMSPAITSNLAALLAFSDGSQRKS